MTKRLKLVQIAVGILVSACTLDLAWAGIAECVLEGIEQSAQYLEFNSNERREFLDFYNKELKNKKFYEIRGEFTNSSGEQIRLGSQALNWFLMQRRVELGINKIPENAPVARATAFEKLSQNELRPNERKPWTINSKDQRSINLQKMHEVPLAPKEASFRERMAVMRKKIEIAKGSSKDRLFTPEELELALRSGIAGDERLRDLERALSQGDPGALIRYIRAQQRAGGLSFNIYEDLAPDPKTGRNKTPEAKEREALAVKAYRAALTFGDRTLLSSEYAHGLMAYALDPKNNTGFTLERFLALTPRFGQTVEIIRPGEKVEFEATRHRWTGNPNTPEQQEVQVHVVIDKPYSLFANLFTVGELRAMGLQLPPRYARENIINPRDNEFLRFASRDWLVSVLIPHINNNILKGTGKKVFIPNEDQLEAGIRMNGERKITTTEYYWGNEWDSKHSPANPTNNWRRAPDVDQHATTELGLANMLGMGWQVTSSPFFVNANEAGPNTRAGSRVAFRGGDFGDDPENCRSRIRYRYHPSEAWHYVGVRLGMIDDE